MPDTSRATDDAHSDKQRAVPKECETGITLCVHGFRNLLSNCEESHIPDKAFKRYQLVPDGFGIEPPDAGRHDKLYT